MHGMARYLHGPAQRIMSLKQVLLVRHTRIGSSGEVFRTGEINELVWVEPIIKPGALVSMDGTV